MATKAEIHIGGSFTVVEAPGRREALLDALEDADILDIQLWGVVEIDMVGVMTLVDVHGEARKIGKTINLINQSTEVRAAFSHFREALKEVEARQW